MDAEAIADLDARIAEALFGLTPTMLCHGPVNGWWCESEWCDAESVCPYDELPVPHPIELVLPDFSSTWEGAAKVIDAMRERGWYCSLHQDSLPGDVWYASFQHLRFSTANASFSEIGEYRDARDQSPQVAICEAALKALEVTP